MVNDISVPATGSSALPKKGVGVGPKLALLLLMCGMVALFVILRWQAGHRAITAESAEIVADSATVIAPVSGTIQQIVVKPGDAVKAGDLLAIVSSPELAQRYSQAEQELEHAQKLDTKTQAAVVPPRIEGSMIPNTPPPDPRKIKPLPLAGPSLSSPGPSTPSEQVVPKESKKVLTLKDQLVSAEKLASECAETVKAVQTEVEDAQGSIQSQNSPIDGLKSTVEMAKAKRDKFSGLYNDGIISRSEFQQKQAELDGAQSNLDQALQAAQSSQSLVKSKQDNLDMAIKALGSAKENVAKKQELLAKAQSSEPKPLPTRVAQVERLPEPAISQRSKPFIPHFTFTPPPIAPLGVAFSPDKHSEAQTEVEIATQKLKMIGDQLQACRILAASDGTIASVDVHEGQSLGAKARVMSIVKPGSQRIIATFSHAKAVRIRSGQYCQVMFDLYPHHPFKGQISRFLESGTSSAPAKLEILLPGQAKLLGTLPSTEGTQVQVIPS